MGNAVREDSVSFFLENTNIKNIIMDKFMKTMEKDVRKDNFTKKEMVVYGIIVPLALVLIMGLAGWIENSLG